MNLHIAALNGFVKFEKEHHWLGIPKTVEYLSELNQIIDSGFLKEFIMEEYSHIMIVPKETVFNFVGYDKWKLEHPLKINLNEYFSIVSYKAK